MKNSLREYRLKNGLSLRQLSEKTNISYGLLGFYESGRRSPSFKNADRIASFFKVPLETVFPQFERLSPKHENTTNQTV